MFFSPNDAGTTVDIRYEYAARRVAVLLPATLDAPSDVLERLREELGRQFSSRGYDVLPDSETDAALRAAGVLVPRSELDYLSLLASPDAVTRIAAKGDVALVVPSFATGGSADASEHSSSEAAHRRLGLVVAVIDGSNGLCTFTKSTVETGFGGLGGLVAITTEELLSEYFGKSSPAGAR